MVTLGDAWVEAQVAYQKAIDEGRGEDEAYEIGKARFDDIYTRLVRTQDRYGEAPEFPTYVGSDGQEHGEF